jgi:hypothetical protein
MTQQPNNVSAAGVLSDDQFNAAIEPIAREVFDGQYVTTHWKFAVRIRALLAAASAASKPGVAQVCDIDFSGVMGIPPKHDPLDICPKCSCRRGSGSQCSNKPCPFDQTMHHVAAASAQATAPVGWFVQRSSFGPWIEVERYEDGAVRLHRMDGDQATGPAVQFTPSQLATLYMALGHFKSSGSVKCADSIMSIIKMDRG